MSRRLLVVVTAAVAGVVLAVVLLFVVFPSGSSSARAAALEHVRDKGDRGSAGTLAEQDHGGGVLVLVGYERRGVRRLGLAFAAKQARGWQVQSYTEEPVEPDDVVVGSLLVASSRGGEGQPPWSAAVGELLDKRIDRVEVEWANGDETTGSRKGDAYLVVQRGEWQALEARYLAKDGSEIATVPVANQGP